MANGFFSYFMEVCRVTIDVKHFYIKKVNQVV